MAKRYVLDVGRCTDDNIDDESTIRGKRSRGNEESTEEGEETRCEFERRFATPDVPRDFLREGSGRPEFIDWCFHAPWLEPSQPLRTFSSSPSPWNETFDEEEEGATPTTTAYGGGFFESDPRHEAVRFVLNRDDSPLTPNASPFTSGGVCAAVAAVTEEFERQGGFLRVPTVCRFIEDWCDVVGSADMLRLLRHIPRSSLSEIRSSAPIGCLIRILRKFQDERVNGIKKSFHGEDRCDGMLPPLSSYTSLPVTFLDEGTGRIWLWNRALEYYQSIAPLMLDLPQAGIVRTPIATTCRDGVTVATPSVNIEEETVNAIFSKTLLVIEIARISNDLFSSSFLAMLRSEETDSGASTKPLTDLFERAMSNGHAIVAIPYSFFAPKRIVARECLRLLAYDSSIQNEVVRIALRYMLMVRGIIDTEYGRDRIASGYDIQCLMGNFERFRVATFFRKSAPSRDSSDSGVTTNTTVSTLRQLSLEIMLRNDGMEHTLRVLSQYALSIDIFAIMHRYFAFGTWNFVNVPSLW